MQKSRVLVIEDEAAVRTFLQRALEPTYEVDAASHGQEGLEQAQRKQPQLILLDLRLPGWDGLTVLAKLKGNPKTAAIPVVIVSGRGETDLLMEGQRSGAVEHLIKPVTGEALRTVVERQIMIRAESDRTSTPDDAR